MTNKAKNKPSGTVRIIGGQWRGRRLPVADLPGLRPTSDRLRETLFNWLQPYIHGATCLDLFAGTGALGFEAVSRGAQHALLVERNRAAIDNLREIKQLLSADNITICQADALSLCLQPPEQGLASYQIAFIDPPWALNCQQQILEALLSNHWLAQEAIIYVEMPKNQEIPSIASLHEIQRKQFGDATALLLCHKNSNFI